MDSLVFSCNKTIGFVLRVWATRKKYCHQTQIILTIARITKLLVIFWNVLNAMIVSFLLTQLVFVPP